MSFLNYRKLFNRTKVVDDFDKTSELTYQTEAATERWYAHSLNKYEPNLAQFGFKIDQPSAYDDIIASRLIRYFQFMADVAQSEDLTPGLDMWSNITKRHSSLQEALISADRSTVTKILREVATGPLVAGFMNVQPYDRLRGRSEACRREAKFCADKVLSLSEALGCSAVQGVEQGLYGYDDVDIASLLEDIKKKLTFDIEPPEAGGGSFGAKYGSSIISIKDLYAIYTAMLATRLLDKSNARVAEIGGGTGTLAYYLAKAGLHVSIYDLPTVSVIQAYYLMRSLGPDRVWLYGEHHTEANARVSPNWALSSEPAKSFDLLINQDSLPEINRTAAIDYIKLIISKGAAFLSINQEGRASDEFDQPQAVVFELVESVGGLMRLSRALHWMRVGYVEEYYRVGTS